MEPMDHTQLNEYIPPPEMHDAPEVLEEWSYLVRKIQPFESDMFRRKMVLTQPNDIERQCAQILSEQLGLNCCGAADDIVISKPSSQDWHARRVLIDFCRFDKLEVDLPALDSFELECFRTQGEMLGLKTLKREDNSLYVSKAPNQCWEVAELERKVSDEFVSPELKRSKSMLRLSESMIRSSSFCDLDAAEAAEHFRRSQSFMDSASVSEEQSPSNSAAAPLQRAQSNGRGLARIESQRVLDQTATLSSSLQHTSFSMLEPQKENVWYIGGTDGDGNIGVFKSEDTEALGVGSEVSTTTSSREGFAQNSGYVREVVAYKLDHKAWVGVPPTIAYSLSVEGQAVEGSVQSFIDHNHSADEDDVRNPGGWKDHERYPAVQVHKVGILDVRLFNTDRHGGNLLVREQDGDVELVPIDHGLCLPDYHHLEMPTQPVWFLWAQAEQPFDQDVCRYVEQLSLEDDLEILHKCGIEPDSIATFRLCHTLLKGAIVGMAPCSYTLRDLGEILVQTTVHEPSIFASWVRQAEQEGEDVVEWFDDNHLGHLAQRMRIKLFNQYRSATEYIQRAIDNGGLEHAISKDRFGLDSRGKRNLEQLMLTKPEPPSSEHSQLLRQRNLAGCTRAQLAEIREQVCRPWWNWAFQLSEIGKRVGYPKLSCEDPEQDSLESGCPEPDMFEMIE